MPNHPYHPDYKTLDIHQYIREHNESLKNTQEVKTLQIENNITVEISPEVVVNIIETPIEEVMLAPIPPSEVELTLKSLEGYCGIHNTRTDGKCCLCEASSKG